MKTAGKQTTSRIEYRLRLTPISREEDQASRTELTLETSRQFASFRYELGVEEQLTKDALHLKVTGLRTPDLSLPASGPATFRKEYQNLHGPLNITIEGLDGRQCSFSVEISRKLIRLIKAPSVAFVEVITGKS